MEPFDVSKNRDRLLNQEVARSFFARVREQAQPYMSDEHFTVDGTMIEAWASQKSFQKKEDGDSGDGGNFHGHKRRNDTHASKTDPDAKLYRKGHGQEARLSYLGHVLMENRNGLIADAMVTEADGTAEREVALLMVHDRWRRREPISSVGADKAYDTREFVGLLRNAGSAACDAEREASGRERDRRAHHAACKLSDEPEAATAHRARLRLDEIGGRNPQSEVARIAESRLVVPDHGSGV